MLGWTDHDESARRYDMSFLAATQAVGRTDEPGDELTAKGVAAD